LFCEGPHGRPRDTHIFSEGLWNVGCQPSVTILPFPLILVVVEEHAGVWVNRPRSELFVTRLYPAFVAVEGPRVALECLTEGTRLSLYVCRPLAAAIPSQMRLPDPKVGLCRGGIVTTVVNVDTGSGPGGRPSDMAYCTSYGTYVVCVLLERLTRRHDALAAILRESAGLTFQTEGRGLPVRPGWQMPAPWALWAWNDNVSFSL
jgi:hypothetical protein